MHCRTLTLHKYHCTRQFEEYGIVNLSIMEPRFISLEYFIYWYMCGFVLIFQYIFKLIGKPLMTRVLNMDTFNDCMLCHGWLQDNHASTNMMNMAIALSINFFYECLYRNSERTTLPLSFRTFHLIYIEGSTHQVKQLGGGGWKASVPKDWYKCRIPLNLWLLLYNGKCRKWGNSWKFTAASNN